MNRLQAIETLNAFTIDPFEVLTPRKNSVIGFISRAKMKNLGDLLITSVNKSITNEHIVSHGHFRHLDETSKEHIEAPRIFDSFASTPLTFYPIKAGKRVIEVCAKTDGCAMINEHDSAFLRSCYGFNNIERLITEKGVSVVAYEDKGSLYGLLITNSSGFMPFDEATSMLESYMIDRVPLLFEGKGTMRSTKHSSRRYGVSTSIENESFDELMIELEAITETGKFEPVVIDTADMSLFKPSPVYDAPMITEEDIIRASKTADSVTESLNFDDRYELTVKILLESFHKAYIDSLLDVILELLVDKYMQYGGARYLHKISNSYLKLGLDTSEAMSRFEEKHPKMSLLKNVFQEVYEDVEKKELDAPTRASKAALLRQKDKR